MPTKHAKDIMIPLNKYPNIPHTFSLKEAVAEMEMSVIEVKGQRSLPRALLVFDDNQQLLGIVRRRDILRGLEPKFLKTMPITHRKQLFNIEVDPNLVDLSQGKIAKSIQDQSGLPVTEVMQPVVTTVDYEDHLAKIIYKMVNMDLNLIPVVKDQKVVGVVRSVDVFNEIAHMLFD
ncbi:MAG: CBS domain-containing protein [candidate division Zixibacteria bacterium]|nr:CBS domain-containing protein [candidate division Zixibacteria bacterium]MDD5425181.1 CBS domain-containing protein [candidate division Zixibacteria bacterium]